MLYAHIYLLAANGNYKATNKFHIYLFVQFYFCFVKLLQNLHYIFAGSFIKRNSCGNGSGNNVLLIFVLGNEFGCNNFKITFAAFFSQQNNKVFGSVINITAKYHFKHLYFLLSFNYRAVKQSAEVLQLFAAGQYHAHIIIHSIQNAFFIGYLDERFGVTYGNCGLRHNRLSY